MDDIIIRKQEIRSRHLALRESLSHEERASFSRRIMELLKQEEAFKEAQILLPYVDYRSEVKTTGLLEEVLAGTSKRVFVPKVEGLKIAFYEIVSLEELAAGYQGIREPLGETERQFTKELAASEKCLLLMPGAVFDRQRERLGYGKGFYDRFLQEFPDLPRAGLAFSCQIAARIPVQEHDKKADFVVTEKGVIR